MDQPHFGRHHRSLSYLKHFRWAMLAGMITFFLPSVLGFSGVSMGFVDLPHRRLSGGYPRRLSSFLSDEAESGWAQQRQV